MASILMHSRVKNYEEWRKVFESNAGLRASNGRLSEQVFRDASDPNVVFILLKWNSLANAQKFAQSPELKAAMEKAGVEGPPHFHFLNET